MGKTFLFGQNIHELLQVADASGLPGQLLHLQNQLHRVAGFRLPRSFPDVLAPDLLLPLLQHAFDVVDQRGSDFYPFFRQEGDFQGMRDEG